MRHHQPAPAVRAGARGRRRAHPQGAALFLGARAGGPRQGAGRRDHPGGHRKGRGGLSGGIRASRPGPAGDRRCLAELSAEPAGGGAHPGLRARRAHRRHAARAGGEGVLAIRPSLVAGARDAALRGGLRRQREAARGRLVGDVRLRGGRALCRGRAALSGPLRGGAGAGAALRGADRRHGGGARPAGSLPRHRPAAGAAAADQCRRAHPLAARGRGARQRAVEGGAAGGAAAGAAHAAERAAAQRRGDGEARADRRDAQRTAPPLCRGRGRTGGADRATDRLAGRLRGGARTGWAQCPLFHVSDIEWLFLAINH